MTALPSPGLFSNEVTLLGGYASASSGIVWSGPTVGFGQVTATLAISKLSKARRYAWDGKGKT